MKYLLRYGEIGLKSSHVRRAMKERLIANTARLFRHEGDRCAFREEEGRLFLESEYQGANDILSRVFGLVSFSAVEEETSSSLEEMAELAVEMARLRRSRGLSFALRVRRVGDHPYTSMEVARQAGSAILSAFPNLKVNLNEPDWELFLEIRGEKTYLYSGVQAGPGGLPLGTQGKVIAHVEAPEGVLTAWLMMKRGCWVVPVFLEEERWCKALTYWNPDIGWHRVGALRDMGSVAETEGALGFAFPGNLTDLDQEGLRPAFYPLLGLSGEKLRELREKVLGPVGG